MLSLSIKVKGQCSAFCSGARRRFIPRTFSSAASSQPIDKASKKKEYTNNGSFVTAPIEDEEMDNVFLLYTGQSRAEISRDVTHVQVHPSVKTILPRAFEGCTQLREVNLTEGLETIGGKAFRNCFSLENIQLPNTVTSISRNAFEDCMHLREVELNEGLRAIKKRAFAKCSSLVRIVLPSTVTSIGHGAFRECTRLWEVELNEGLEIIDNGAFAYCTSLEYIKVPSTVTSISCSKAFESYEHMEEVYCSERKDEFVSSLKLDYWGRVRTSLRSVGTFEGCSNLRVVELCEGITGSFVLDPTLKCSSANKSGRGIVKTGVETIGSCAFYGCTSLELVILPSTVKSIDASAFDGCNSIESMEFCEEIEDFVSGESMRGWWNQGRSQEALLTYCFLIEHNIPMRVGLLHCRKWQLDIQDMLRCLPSIIGTSPIGIPSSKVTKLGNTYLSSINAKLTEYESLKDAATVLELAIWKTKLDEHGNDMLLCNMDDATKRAEQRDTCGATVIIPNVLSFLVVE